MLVNKRKLFLYEVDPLFFHDSSNDGFGDFEGFYKKIDYFKTLGVDGVIFPDIFNQEEVILKPSNISIFNKYGKLTELKQIIEWFSKNKIDFFLEIDLRNILDSNMNMDVDKKKIIDILIKNINDDQNVNWGTKKRIDLFKKIISFWSKHGVKNFIFTNFEFLYSNSKELNQILIDQLRKNYNIVKEINNISTVSLKSSIYSSKVVNVIFDKYIGKICDMYIDNFYPFLCTNKANPLDKYQKFVPKKIFNRLKKIKIKPIDYYRYVCSFGSNKIGRVSSRWMDEESLHSESIKTLHLILNALPYSSINYYGDELGMLRSKIDTHNDYYDFDYTEKKRHLESKGYSEEKFNFSQLYLSPIHSQSIMNWDNNQVNNGFSQSNELIRKTQINARYHSVSIQNDEKDSILNFYIQLIKLFKSRNWIETFKNISDIKIKKFMFRDLFRYTFVSKNKSDKVRILINPTNKNICKKIGITNQIILSSYPLKSKTISSSIKLIKPYESFIYKKIK